MAQKLSTPDAEIVATLKAIKQHKSGQKAAHALGIGEASVRRHIALAKQRNLTAESVVIDPVAKAEATIRSLRSELAGINRDNLSAADIRRTIYGLAENSPSPPKWLSSAKFSGTPGCPMTMWSDWHYGEVVNPDEVGGLNTFNSEIAQQRIKRLVDRTIRLTKGFAFKEHGKDAKFPGIVVCLGGDMISGDIHEELNDTNDRKPLECINELLDIIAGALERLANEFGHVFVPCVVGNHGRTSRKPRAKSRVFTSYEWNLYTNLERHFRNDSRVSFHIPHETDARFSVLGHRFLLTHGDSLGTKGGDGIIGALGPIMRGRVKIANAEMQIGRDFDTMVCGHWHQEIMIPGLHVNPTLKGVDEYSIRILRVPYARPAQALWFVHDQQGITARLSVYVDDVPKLKKKPAWVIVGG
jgi:hypothetical protein